MARGKQRLTLIGNLGKDIDLRYTQGGTAVGNTSLAVGERVKRDGEWADHTEWFNLVLWGKTAENAAQYLHKGSQVYLEGKVRTRKWQDRDGNDRWSTEVHVDDILYLGGGKGSETNSRPQTAPAQPATGSDWPDDGGFDPNDDVPF